MDAPFTVKMSFIVGRAKSWLSSEGQYLALVGKSGKWLNAL